MDDTSVCDSAAAPARAAAQDVGIAATARRLESIDGFLDDLSRGFGLVLVQPTTRCNIDCAYCYLPGRDERNRMPVEVAEAVAQGIAAQAAPLVTVLWHGGEPLATRHAYFERLLQPFEDLRAAGRVAHGMQTNATLINDRWCRLFIEYGVGVGVSIDGPEDMNPERRDWQGRETFDRAMRGIAHLKAHEIPFSVLPVIRPETIGRAREVLAFLDRLGAAGVGFNFRRARKREPRAGPANGHLRASRGVLEGSDRVLARHPRPAGSRDR